MLLNVLISTFFFVSQTNKSKVFIFVFAGKKSKNLSFPSSFLLTKKKRNEIFFRSYNKSKKSEATRKISSSHQRTGSGIPLQDLLEDRSDHTFFYRRSNNSFGSSNNNRNNAEGGGTNSSFASAGNNNNTQQQQHHHHHHHASSSQLDDAQQTLLGIAPAPASSTAASARSENDFGFPAGHGSSLNRNSTSGGGGLLFDDEEEESDSFHLPALLASAKRRSPKNQSFSGERGVAASNNNNNSVSAAAPASSSSSLSQQQQQQQQHTTQYLASALPVTTASTVNATRDLPGGLFVFVEGGGSSSVGGSFGRSSSSHNIKNSGSGNSGQYSTSSLPEQRLSMADRFVQDILSDGSPMVASARYTDQLFAPQAASSTSHHHHHHSSNLASSNAYDRVLNDDDGLTPRELPADGGSNSGSPPLPGEKPRSNTLSVQAENEDDSMRASIAQEVQWMLRFALLFVNFTFVVSSLLMTLAGAIAVNTPSLTICTKCRNLARAPVVLGLLLWFSGLFAFYWIKQRTVLFLLLHAGVVVVVAVILLVLIIIGIVFNGSITELSKGDLLQAWTGRIANISASVESPLCALQEKNNCSGVAYGCCTPGMCYDALNPPAWVAVVCPVCTQPQTPEMCTWDVLQTTTQSDMRGFIVVMCFAFILVITGMGLAMFVRHINNATGNHN